MTDGQVQPVPKRWWWRKRIGLLVAAFLLALGICYGFWDRHATKVLAEQTAAIRARGEPLEFRELAPASVPPAENAADLYAAASTAWQSALASLVTIAIDGGEAPEFDAAELKKLIDEAPVEKALRQKRRRELAKIFEISKPARDLCRQARPLTRADWGMNFNGPALTMMLPGLGAYRDLARLLATCALHAHDSENDAEAVEAIRDALALARAIGETPTLVNALVEMACTSVTFEPIEEMLPTLKVGPAPGASREQVRAVIDNLLDDRPAREHFARAMMAERSMHYDTFERFRRGEFGGVGGLAGTISMWNVGGPTAPAGKSSIPNRVVLKLSDPVLKLDEARSLGHMTAYVDAARADNLPDGRRRGPPPYQDMDVARRMTRMISTILMPALGRANELHFRGLTGRRMAAVALAIRLYEIDHGRRPAKLADLLPKYLDKLPADPFRDDGATFGYLPEAEHPMLYTVGLDSVDDGGRYGFKEDGDQIDSDVLDWPFFLDGARPTRPAETQP